MVKQHMNIYKKITLGTISALTLLCGCTKEIPEGDIKNFVEAIDYNTTYKNVNKGEGIIEIKHYLENKPYTPPTIYEKVNVAMEQVGYMIEEKGERVAICEARKHLAW